MFWETPGLTGFLEGERRAVSDTDRPRHSRCCLDWHQGEACPHTKGVRGLWKYCPSEATDGTDPKTVGSQAPGLWSHEQKVSKVSLSVLRPTLWFLFFLNGRVKHTPEFPFPPESAGDPGGAGVASRSPAVTAQMEQWAGSLFFPSAGQHEDAQRSWDCPLDLSSP